MTPPKPPRTNLVERLPADRPIPVRALNLGERLHLRGLYETRSSTRRWYCRWVSTGSACCSATAWRCCSMSPTPSRRRTSRS
ncbi:MAG: hypothetical protein MZV70_63610 [Desulfobacterales bacterium]|nr:hypothetical protein [Desulfobacterales bacterium]